MWYSRMWLRCDVNVTPKAAEPSIIYNTKQPIVYSSFGVHVMYMMNNFNKTNPEEHHG